MIDTDELVNKAIEDLANATTACATLTQRADLTANQIAQIYLAANQFLDGFAELRRVYLDNFRREQPLKRRTVRRVRK